MRVKVLPVAAAMRVNVEDARGYPGRGARSKATIRNSRGDGRPKPPCAPITDVVCLQAVAADSPALNGTSPEDHEC